MLSMMQSHEVKSTQEDCMVVVAITTKGVWAVLKEEQKVPNSSYPKGHSPHESSEFPEF